MTIGIVLDVVVILLLVPTIIYAIILNRRLTALRRSREELSKVVNSFNDATMRAEAGIPKLKKATTEANHTLKERVDKAQTLRDDLAFMIERAEELAARLEGAVRNARAEGVTQHVAPAQAGPAPRAMNPMGANMSAAMNPAAEPPSRAGAAAGMAGTLAQTAAGFEETAAELRNALGAARAEARVNGPATSALSQVLSQAGQGIPNMRGKRPDRGADRPLERAPERMPERSLAERSLAERHERVPAAFDDERSEAERELLKALQSAR